MATHKTSDSGNQDGFYSVAGGWDETSATMGKLYIGLRFKISKSGLDSESRPLDPPRLYSPFSLTLYTSNSVGTSSTVDLKYVPESAPEAYSDSLRPTTRGELFFRDTDGVKVDNVTQTVASGTAADTAVTFEDIDISALLPFVRTSAWNGHICLTLVVTSLGGLQFHTAEGSNSAYVPVLTTNEVPFHTGILNGPALDRRARSRICPKIGMPVSSDEMVRDGYSEGLMVSPEAFDPDDPEDLYVPSPFEGVVDDEV